MLIQPPDILICLYDSLNANIPPESPNAHAFKQRDHRHLRAHFIEASPPNSGSEFAEPSPLFTLKALTPPPPKKTVDWFHCLHFFFLLPACMRCFLDFRRGLLTWNQREASQFFFFLLVSLGLEGRGSKKKEKKKKLLAAFVLVPAESIKPAHQLGNADSFKPWIIKRSPSTRSGDWGRENRGRATWALRLPFVKVHRGKKKQPFWRQKLRCLILIIFRFLFRNVWGWGGWKKAQEGQIMLGIRLQLATPATLKVKQFIPALEFIAG